MTILDNEHFLILNELLDESVKFIAEELIVEISVLKLHLNQHFSSERSQHLICQIQSLCSFTSFSEGIIEDVKTCELAF